MQQELRSSLTPSELVSLWGGAIAQLNSVSDLRIIAANKSIPTIADVSVAFGNDTAVSIILEHLLSLCKNVDRELTAYQFVDTALLIATEFYFLNLSELALFFRNCKTGKYGQLVWGSSLNVQQIMTATRTFLGERISAINSNEKERIEKQKDKSFIRIDTAAQSMIVGVESIRELNKKAKNDFKTFCELFPKLPSDYPSDIWWEAWRGNVDAVKAIYGPDHPSMQEAERYIGKYLCDYNIQENVK